MPVALVYSFFVEHYVTALSIHDGSSLGQTTALIRSTCRRRRPRV